MSPAPEKCPSEGTDVGGAERYLTAKLASSEKRSLFSAHQLKAFSRWNGISGSERYLSMMALCELMELPSSTPASSSISEKHANKSVLGRFGDGSLHSSVPGNSAIF